MNHVVKMILVLTLFILMLLFLTDRVARWMMLRWGSLWGNCEWTNLSSLPWIASVLIFLAFLGSPAVLAYSRQIECDADQFGLELNQDGWAAASGFVRIQSENLRVPRPLPIYTYFFATHPSLESRIQFCNSYHSHDHSDRGPR